MQTRTFFVRVFFRSGWGAERRQLSAGSPYLGGQMNNSTPRPPAWLGIMTWVPLLLYFVVKYLVIGRDNMTTTQSLLLLGFVVLAEIALWRYRRKFTSTTAQPEDDGTDT